MPSDAVHPQTVEPPSPETRRVIREGRAARTESIAEAVVIKSDDLFFLCDRSADVPERGSHGLGLYFHDCRYLSAYTLRLGRNRGVPLAVEAGAGSWCAFELTNPDLAVDSENVIDKETLSLKWTRTLSGPQLTLQDTIVITSFSTETIAVPITVALHSEFESLFQVRGAQPARRGRLREPEWRDHVLTLAYEGADDIERRLVVEFEPAPQSTERSTATFLFHLLPRDGVQLRIALRVSERKLQSESAPGFVSAIFEDREVHEGLKQASDKWLDDGARVRCNSLLLEKVVDRAMRDLHILNSSLHGFQYFAAGVPWFVTLFGRDSLIATLEVLAFAPWVAADTIRLMAAFQGTDTDEWREEQPGKMMHELRVGEMARLHEIPQTPYYGSVDSTPLFLILLARHAAWTGRLDLFREMLPHVEAAVDWIDRQMAAAPHGYLTYSTTSTHGLINQGWKDSGDAISNRDGTLARGPIALIEVQGYVYLAKLGIADLYRRLGNSDLADRLVRDAARLRERVDRDFWSDDLATFAIALQENGRQAEIVTSNPGHALWTGLASEEHAARTAEGLLKDDMYSGWGIRTLSNRERRFNPLGYHVGTVWPHDNALAAAGFRRYGFLDKLERVLTGIVEAAGGFELYRLPEVFGGLDRSEYTMPVRYPVACHPQAWAAGAVPFMLESALGLDPCAFERRLLVHQPCLPRFVDSLHLHNVAVADARTHLYFRRDRAGRVSLADARVDGDLEIEVVNP